MRRWFVFILIAAIALAGGCASSRPDGALYVAAGTSQSVWYPLVTGLAEALSPDCPTQAEVTTGGIENCIRVGKHDLNFGVINSNAAPLALEGAWPFTEAYDLYAVGTLYNSNLQLVVFADSGIETVEQLKGKRIVLSPPGGTTYIASLEVLAAYGIGLSDIVPIECAYSEGALAMRDGHCDAMMVTMPAPNSSIVDLTLARPIRLLNIDKVAEIAERNDTLLPSTADASLYNGGAPDIVQTVAVGSMLITNDRVPEGQVYSLLTALFDNRDRLRNVHAVAGEICLETAAKTTIPLHPEAARFYRERGVEIS